MQADFTGTNLAYLQDVDRDVGEFSEALIKGDPLGVVRMVLDQHGIVVFEKSKVADVIADTTSLNQQASALFSQGMDAPEIIKLYSRSLNINPAQSAIWSQLGSVFIAFGHAGAANAMFMQALLQQPLITDHWIYLARTLVALGHDDQGHKLAQVAQSLSSVFPLSEWGEIQVKKIVRTNEN